VNFNNKNNFNSIVFYDVTGKIQLEKDLVDGKNQLDIRAFSIGIYYAKLMHKDGTNQLMKVVKL
jgi:hypothetical protein